MPGEVGDTSRSIAFDRAVAYYDATRSLRPATQEAIIEQLTGELAGRGRCLEVGVGTGRIALDLHRRGVAMAGVDLSAPMLRRLVEKAGGAAPFPLAVADATRLPVAGDGVGAAIVCHVLHLIEAWQRAVDELVRVVRPGGLILIESAKRESSAIGEVSRFFWTATRLGRRDVPGLADLAAVDPLLSGLGFRARLLPPIVERTERSMGELIAGLEDGILSGCWELSEDERRSAAASTREWASRRHGSLDAPHVIEQTITWRAYDAP